MNTKTLLSVAGIMVLVLAIACVKSSNPTPPVTDTVIVTKTDTLLLPPLSDTPTTLKNGLVLYLPFNGSFADSSGNGNTVTSIGGAILDYDMHGYAQSAFSAPVNGAKLIVSNNGAYQVDSAFSVSCDFMIRANAYFNGGYDFSGLMVFCSIVNVTTGAGPTFDFGLTLPSQPSNFAFGVNGAQSPDDCTNNNNNGPDTSIGVGAGTSFVPQVGSWYNAICIFNKGTTSVYINGQLINSVTNSSIPTAMFCPESNFVVGGWWNGGNSGEETINGKLDEVRMYNRSLDSAEIAWLSRNFQPNSISTKASSGVKTGGAPGIGFN